MEIEEEEEDIIMVTGEEMDNITRVGMDRVEINEIRDIITDGEVDIIEYRNVN